MHQWPLYGAARRRSAASRARAADARRPRPRSVRGRTPACARGSSAAVSRGSRRAAALPRRSARPVTTSPAVRWVSATFRARLRSVRRSALWEGPAATRASVRRVSSARSRARVARPQPVVRRACRPAAPPGSHVSVISVDLHRPLGAVCAGSCVGAHPRSLPTARKNVIAGGARCARLSYAKVDVRSRVDAALGVSAHCVWRR